MFLFWKRFPAYDEYRDHWQQKRAAQRFASFDDMLKFSPLEQGDFTGWQVVADGDYRSEEVIYDRYRKGYPAEWGDAAPAGSSASAFFYNTMFMWPMLTFGYENVLKLCLDPEFERIMDEFAEINRRLFRAHVAHAFAPARPSRSLNGCAHRP